MAVTADKVVVELEAKIAQFQQKIAQAAQSGDQAFGKIGKVAGDAERTVSSAMTKAATSADRAMARIAAATRSTRDVIGGFGSGLKQGWSEALADAEAKAGKFGGALGFVKSAIGGFVATLSVAKLVEITQRSIEYAAALKTTAQQLGVTTEQLQVYRYAGTQVGITQSEIDGSLQRLNKSLGEAALGSKQDAKLFQALGFSLAEIKKGISAGDAMPRLADALKQISDPAKRAAIEMRLFGETGQRLDTLLAGGSAAIENLRQAAQRLGIVLSTDQIENADKTASKLADLKQVLAANVAGAVANNAAAIAGLADSLIHLASSIPGAIRAWQEWRLQMAIGLKEGVLNSPVLGLGGALRGLPNSITGLDPSGNRADLAELRVQDVMARLGFTRSVLPSRGIKSTTPKLGNLDNLLAPERRKRQSHGPTEEQIRERFTQELEREKQEQLQLEAGTTQDIIKSSMLQRDANEAQFNSAVAAVKRDKYFSDEQKTRLIEEKRVTYLARANRINFEENNKLANDEIELTQARLQIAQDLLTAQRARARTPGQQRAIDLALLANERQGQEARLNDVISDDGKFARFTPSQVQTAKEQLAALPALFDAKTREVIHNTLTPLQDFLDRIPKDAEEVNIALESIETDGLRALNDGLADAIVNSKSLGDVFHNVAKQIIADLIRMALQQAELKIFGSFLGGGGGGGGSVGSGLASIGGSILGLFGRASGGYVGAGQLVRINEAAAPGRVEGFRPQGSGTVIPLGQMNAAASRPSGVTVVNEFSFDMRGAITSERVLGQVNAMVKQGQAQSVAAAVKITEKSAPGRLRQYQTLGS